MDGLQPAAAPDAARATLKPVTVAGSGRRLAVNAIAGGAGNGIKICVQLVMLPLMAHLLGPTEFGIYALALPTISFCMILADGGLAASLAREPLESVLVWSTGFWLIMAVGVLLATFVVVWGLALATLSREPRVRELMDILSLSLIMISIAALPSARLTREARLTVFAAADVVSTIVGACVGLSLALSGFGAKSLAVQYVTYYTLRAIILNSVAFVRPRFQFQLSALISHLSIGSALLSVKVSDFLGRMVENLLYGRVFGATGLGVYTFANQAPRFICEAASGPVWAALYAFALRESPNRIEQMHLTLSRLLASVVFPVAALLSASAPQVLALILGAKWAEAGDLMRLLVPFYALTVVSTQAGAIMLARGRGWTLFGVSLILTAGRVAAVAGGPWLSQRGVAVGINAALALYSLAMVSSLGLVGDTRRTLGALAPAALASLAAGAICSLSLHVAGSHLSSLAVSWIVGGAVYLLVLTALDGSRLRGDLKALKAALSSVRRAGATRGFR
jgi:PST family polysaccharide transporter